MLISKMKKLRENEIKNYKMGTRSILHAAFRKNIAVYKFFDTERVFVLKKNRRTAWIRGPRLSVSNPVSLWIIKDKFLTKEALRHVGIPFPKGFSANTPGEAVAIAKKITFPVIIKPRRGEGGKHVFLNIDSVKKLKQLVAKVFPHSKQVLIEKQVDGKYYRITMVDHKIAGILETEGIRLKGDGINTIEKLINNYNREATTPYKITTKTHDMLLFQNLSLKSTPTKGASFILGFSGAEGGSWIDRTDLIGKKNSELLSKLTKYLDLNLAGIDLIAKDIALPITDRRSPGYVLEINGAPEFLFHLSPTQGKPRDIGAKIINMLFK